MLLDNPGLLVLVIDRLGSIGIDSKEVSGPTDGIRLLDCLEQLLPLAICYHGVDPPVTFTVLDGFGLGLLGGVEYLHYCRGSQSDRLYFYRFK